VLRRLTLGARGDLAAPLGDSDDPGPNVAPITQFLGAFSLDAHVDVLGAPDDAQLYVLAGNGVVWTRPASLVDPAHRHFGYDARLAMAFGLGARLPITKGLSVLTEIGDTIYIEQTETSVISVSRADDSSTWYGARPLRNRLDLRLALAFSWPTS
jgi:hypothetical protein